MLTEQAERHYRGDAGRRYQESKRGLPEQAIPWVAALRSRKFAPLIGSDDVVLEYGVGSGWNLGALACRRKIGFDIADFLEASLRAQGIEFVADTKVLPDAVADVVICHHTLEHVLHPSDVLEEIRRLLKPAGRLLLYVPFEREGRYEHFNPAEPNHHLYSWNVQTLGNLVVEAGFEVSNAGVGEFGYSRFAANWAAKLHLGETGFRAVRQLLHGLRPAYEVRLIAVKPSPT
ncbi:MAG TPA: class I SAM-dependent methyltransferase [Verrucomicrobiae bacterium]|jgi:SAM-dependent methyltransferase|nr:class I SAM-dependent methyltransferase [Verrucomicrobiae bacterium]